MAKINYEFDHDPLPPDDLRWARRMRLALIFLVTAGVTAGLIWWIVPKEEELPPAVPPAAEESAGEFSPVPLQEGEAGGEAPAEDALPGGDAVELPPAEESPEAEASSPSEEVPVSETPTDVPEKDRPWVGDPVEDGPALVEDRQPVSFDGIAQVREQLTAGAFPEAWNGARQLLETPGLVENSAKWREAAKLLTEVNLTLLEKGGRIEGKTVFHRARPGESFSLLASRNKTTIEAIKLANGVAESNNILRVGQGLVIYPGPWKIRVEKSARLLKLYNLAGGEPELFAVFDVGIGRLGKTPSAEFVISSRLRNPDWYAPDGGVYKFGEPGNVIGTRFLKLAPVGTPDRPLLGYGIHGTSNEESVTRSRSNGCIRMRNADVEMLYNIVPGMTRVEILD